MGREMAESKGPQDAKGRKQSLLSGAAGAGRSGWARWRPYSAAIIGVAAVFAVSGVIGAHVRGGEKTTVKVPSGLPSSGPKDLAVPVYPDNPVTVTVYEDLRDPASKAFAQQWQPEFDTLLASGRAAIAYRLVTSSDSANGGTGALDAANAAGCAQDQGKGYFAKYVDQLWKHQPADVSDDRFASLPYLEKLGRKVKGLQASVFVPCVQSLDHGGWVRASQKDYKEAGLAGAPVVEVNGTVLTTAGLTPAKLDAAVRSALSQVMATATATATAGPTPSASPTPSTGTVPSTGMTPSTGTMPSAGTVPSTGTTPSA
jgi:protein-disulfide isomerase